MLLQLLRTNPMEFLVLAVALIGALTIHEFAHAWAADRLGDPTPRSQGRLTLNPLAHLDPLGTLLLFVAGFGWGKPVLFDPYNLRTPRRDIPLIAAAGPLSNILLAFVAALLVFILPHPWNGSAAIFFHINVALAAFNLIPLAPLDGSKILQGLLPKRLAYEFEETLSRYGFILLLLFIFPIAGGVAPVSYILGPLIAGIKTILVIAASALAGLIPA